MPLPTYHGANEPGADAPRRGPHQLPGPRLRLKKHVKGPRKVLPEEVRRAGLQRPAVLHQRLDGVRVVGARKALRRALPPLRRVNIKKGIRQRRRKRRKQEII